MSNLIQTIKSSFAFFYFSAAKQDQTPLTGMRGCEMNNNVFLCYCKEYVRRPLTFFTCLHLPSAWLIFFTTMVIKVADIISLIFLPFYSIIRELISNMTTIHICCLFPKCRVLLWPYFLADTQHSSCYLSAWQWNRIVKRFEESSESILLGFKWRDFTN